MKVTVLLDWFDLDDIPEIQEQATDLARRFSHSGMHTGSINIDSVEGPTEDGELTLVFGWVDLDDVPGLLKALENHVSFDGSNTGSIVAQDISFTKE